LKIFIEGNGVFGTFLKNEIEKVSPDSLELNSELADTVILAVPADAYASVSEKHSGKHLVNVCSVQSETNKICSRYSDFVTGLHPLFGVRSPKTDRKLIITKLNKKSNKVIKLFELFSDGTKYLDEDGGVEHDVVMEKTHLKIVQIQKSINEIVADARHIDPDLYPTSFKKLIEFHSTFGDMPEGTLSSILSNPMGK